MLYEMERFTPETLAGLRHQRFRIGDAVFEVHATVYLPLAPALWQRLWRARRHLTPPPALSQHWRLRSDSFLYLYARSQAQVCACGYFDTGYVGAHIDGTMQDYNRQADRPAQIEAFRRFHDEDGPTVRAWYPLLPSLVNFYDIAKNLAVARLIAAHAGSGGRPIRVLEVGAGGCLLPLLLRRLAPVGRHDVIDLPALIPLGAIMAGAFAPDAAIALPGEAAGAPDGGTEPWLRLQAAGAFEVADGGYDVAVNVTSFQEMTQQQVDDYFAVIARALRPGGILVCVNRERKSTDFAAYPWDRLGGAVLLDDEDPLSRFHADDQVILRRIVRLPD